jgi:clostripain
MKYKYAIIFVLIILSISLTGCFIFPPRDNTAEWTVMVYLDADNNLESAGIDDINEMEIVGSTTEVNIVVQVDRIPYSVLASNNEGYADDISNSNWTTTRRYYITQDFDPVQINSQLKSDLGELNMGDSQTLIDFTNWATINYPARKYLLVIWNHGGGFRSLSLTKDIAWDDTSGGDKITMPEFLILMVMSPNQQLT